MARRVERGIPLQACTQDRRKSCQSKSPCTRIPSSKCDDYREGWQDKSHNHHCDVDILYATCGFKRSRMKGELYPPKQGHHMAEPPHSKLKQAIEEHYSCRRGGKHCVNLASFQKLCHLQSWNTVSDQRIEVHGKGLGMRLVYVNWHGRTPLPGEFSASW